MFSIDSEMYGERPFLKSFGTLPSTSSLSASNRPTPKPTLAWSMCSDATSWIGDAFGASSLAPAVTSPRRSAVSAACSTSSDKWPMKPSYCGDATKSGERSSLRI